MNNLTTMTIGLAVVAVIGFVAGTIEKKLKNRKTKNFYNYKMMVNGKMRVVPIVKLTKSPFDGRWAISVGEAKRINKMYEDL
jgi:hypothetical protein